MPKNREPAGPGWVWALAGLVVTLAWAIAATEGQQPRARAAAAAAAALVTATVAPRSVESTLAAVALLGVFPIAMTRPALLAAAIVTVAIVDLAANRSAPDTAGRVVSAVGAVLTAGSLAYTAVDGLGWRLTPQGRPAAALALAGALALLAGRSRVLMVPGLLVALVAIPTLPAAETAIVVAIAAAALAAFDRPGPAIAALGLVGSPLLLAGVLIQHRVALLAAIPGAVATVAALSQAPATAANGALAAGLAATAAIVVWRAQHDDAPIDLHPHHLPALALLAWLTLAPTTWTWAAPANHHLDPYETGIALALAGAGIAAVGTNLRRLRHGTTSPTS